MRINPKVVQQAVRVAIGLANPTLREQDWNQLKERFKLDDDTMKGIRTLVDTCGNHVELKPILNCLTV